MGALKILDQSSIHEITKEVQESSIQSLENGKVIYFPKLAFSLQESEKKFLTPDILSPNSKNISYDLRRDMLAGTIASDNERKDLQQMMKRYALESRKLIESLFPSYLSTIRQGRTSFRPAEIAGRPSSYRKDDTRLHVDAFPSTPVKGDRILRVFANVNPNGAPRIWRVGEPFEAVVEKFGPKVSAPPPFSSILLKLFKVTKDYRTLYDHYMLKIHDTMKGDRDYKSSVEKEEVHFPPNSSWIVYTDQVSHAALSGQHVLEQTFYLPPEGLFNIETSPLRVLEKFFHKKLL